MTTQSTPSPFGTPSQNNSAPEEIKATSSQQDEFHFRTMKEDLANLQSKGLIEEKPHVAKQTELPIQEVSKKKEYNPAEISSENINPFPQQTIESKSSDTPSMVEMPVPVTQTKTSMPSSVKIMIAVAIILIISIAALGLYYFTLSKNQETITEVPEVAVETVQTEPDPVQANTAPQEPEKPQPKYSQTNPNYLQIDTAITLDSDIKNILVKTGEEILAMEDSTGTLYEFLPVDTNNNPISFQTFLTTVKINLLPEIFSSLKDDFSIYFFNDGGKIRIGLIGGIIDKNLLSKNLLKQEETLISNASFLFLNNPIEIEVNPFANSEYKTYKIRFSNANSTKDLSIDYSLTNSQFMFATSKNTLRAILDRLEMKENLTTTNSSTESKLENNNTDDDTTTAELINPDVAEND